MAEMIPVTKEPHPLGVEFVAYYGNGSKRRALVCLDGKDSAISHWYPVPQIPSLSEEVEEMNRILDET